MGLTDKTGRKEVKVIYDLNNSDITTEEKEDSEGVQQVVVRNVYLRLE